MLGLLCRILSCSSGSRLLTFIELYRDKTEQCISTFIMSIKAGDKFYYKLYKLSPLLWEQSTAQGSGKHKTAGTGIQNDEFINCNKVASTNNKTTSLKNSPESNKPNLNWGVENWEPLKDRKPELKHTSITLIVCVFVVLTFMKAFFSKAFMITGGIAV